MYVPRHFEESRPEVLHTLLREHPFATVSQAARAPVADATRHQRTSKARGTRHGMGEASSNGVASR